MISASQASKARDCLRLWAFDWQDPEPYTSGAAAQLGTDVHKVAEDYHVRGIDPSEAGLAGAIFLPSLPFLPHPFVGRAEGEFTARISGVDYRGYIDLQCDATALPGYDGPPCPAVLDYKTIKDLEARRMLDGPGEFLDDPQCLLYALKRLIETGANRVLLRWVYFRREGKPKAVARDALLTRAQVLDAFGRIVHPLAAQLVQLKASKPDPLSLTPTPSRCMKYGPAYPCRHIAKCNLSPALTLGSLMEEDMDLLEQLKAKMASEEAKGVNPPEAKAPMVAVVHGLGVVAPIKAIPEEDSQVAQRRNGSGPLPDMLTAAEIDFVKALFKLIRG